MSWVPVNHRVFGRLVATLRISVYSSSICNHSIRRTEIGIGVLSLRLLIQSSFMTLLLYMKNGWL